MRRPVHCIDHGDSKRLLTTLDDNSTQSQLNCFTLCMRERGVTGCSFSMRDENSHDCHVYTSDIDYDGEESNHSYCWVFKHCKMPGNILT